MSEVKEQEIRRIDDSRKEYELEEREVLQSIKRTLEHIETILMRIEGNQRTESAEDFYKRHGITQTFA